MITSTHFSGFTSNTNFNQIATCTYSDSAAPTANRLGLSVQQTSYSNTGDNFVILDFTITNNTTSPVNGVYVGQMQDWDIGVSTYDQNRGGYDPLRNLAYQYLDGGNPDSSYYGIVALSGWSGASVNTYWDPSTARDSAYKWMSTFLNEPITNNADYRMFVGSGPFDLGVGSSIRVGFAYCAGIDLAGLQDAATSAQFKWDNYVTAVEEVEEKPVSFFLAQNFPNPFNPSTKIKYSVPQSSNVVIKVFDVLGNEIETLVNEEKPAGTYEITWFAENLPSGVYFYQLKAGDFVSTKKMIFLK